MAGFDSQHKCIFTRSKVSCIWIKCEVQLWACIWNIEQLFFLTFFNDTAIYLIVAASGYDLFRGLPIGSLTGSGIDTGLRFFSPFDLTQPNAATVNNGNSNCAATTSTSTTYSYSSLQSSMSAGWEIRIMCAQALLRSLMQIVWYHFLLLPPVLNFIKISPKLASICLKLYGLMDSHEVLGSSNIIIYEYMIWWLHLMMSL